MVRAKVPGPEGRAWEQLWWDRKSKKDSVPTPAGKIPGWLEQAYGCTWELGLGTVGKGAEPEATWDVTGPARCARGQSGLDREGTCKGGGVWQGPGSGRGMTGPGPDGLGGEEFGTGGFGFDSEK